MAWGFKDGQYGWIEEGGGQSNPVTGAPAPAAAPASNGAAPKVANKGTNGSDPKFSLVGLTKVNGNQFQDGAGNIYDDSGRMVSGDWSRLEPTAGLPPSNESESYDVYTGRTTQGSGGGGGGGGGAGMSGGTYFDQLKSLMTAQGNSELSGMKANIQKALIGFGLMPEGFNDKYGAIDDTTRSLIQQNTDSGISYYARLLDQKKDNLRSLIGRLSGSGLRRSGTKGAKLRSGQLDFDRLFQDSLRELLGQTEGMYAGYANSEYQRQIALMQAMMNNQSGGPGPSGNPGGPGGGGGFTPINVGTPLERQDTGGYQWGTQSQGLVDLARGGANVFGSSPWQGGAGQKKYF